MTLAERFLATAASRGAATALIDPGGRHVSFAELELGSARRARAYAAKGIGAGDVVLIMLGLTPELYLTLLALFRLGAVAAFPEPRGGLAGVRHAIAAAKPKALVAGARGVLARTIMPELARLPLLAAPDHKGRSAGDGPLATLPAQSPALITFTSGSTGKAKGIVRSTEALWLQHTLLEDVRRTSPEDVDLISLPIFVFSNLASGAASVIPSGDLRCPARLDGSRLRTQISAHKVTRVVAPPALCAKICEAPVPNVRAIFTGGGPVFPDLWREMQTAAPSARLCAVYGSTEAEPIAHIDWSEISETDWEKMRNGGGLLAGRPIPEIALSLNDNEIEVAGPHVNRGYLNPADNESTKIIRNGLLWHRTGDCGRFDVRGRLWLLGRKMGASNGLFPFAIEAAALSWPGVRQAALCTERDCTVLAVSGPRLDTANLRQRARRLGVDSLVRLRAIPTDRRHNSKVDYARLRALLGQPARQSRAQLVS